MWEFSYSLISNILKHTPGSLFFWKRPLGVTSFSSWSTDCTVPVRSARVSPKAILPLMDSWIEFARESKKTEKPGGYIPVCYCYCVPNYLTRSCSFREILKATHFPSNFYFSGPFFCCWDFYIIAQIKNNTWNIFSFFEASPPRLSSVWMNEGSFFFCIHVSRARNSVSVNFGNKSRSSQGVLHQSP